MTRPSRVLVIGSLTLDTTEGRAASTLGGVATYASLTFARLGLQTTAAFRCADTELWAVQRLQSLGVRVVHRPSVHTTRFRQVVEGDDREQWMPAAADPIGPCLLGSELCPGLHVHLGPLHPGDIDPAVFLEPALGACTVSLDLQGLVRECRCTRILPVVSPSLDAALRCASIVKASQDELALVCRAWSMSERRLAEAYGLEALVITNGSRGGRVVSGSRTCPFDAAQAGAVADSTGAGDVFFAAWLQRRLHAGASIEAASRYAAELAACHVQGRWLPDGALQGPPI